jgi:Ca2+:H+ antiporter
MNSTSPTVAGPASGFRIDPLYWLLAAVPIAIVLHFMHANAVWIFAVSCLAIIPLAGLMGRATEHLAETMGAGVGGLLNASFGNAAELIIAMVALWKGPEMYPLVKASITGSIIGNVLLVLGLSILCGGFKFEKQTFNRTAASNGAAMMALATIGMLVPTLFYNFHVGPTVDPDKTAGFRSLSDEIAVILFVVYLMSLWFSLRTHKHLFAGEPHAGDADVEREPPEWSRKTSLIVLVAATIGVAIMSELLVESVSAAGERLGMTSVFMGVIVVAVIGNAAEHSTAILMAMKNKMDLAVTIAVGSGIQIALFVTPVLVFASYMIGKPLDLHFTHMEIAAIVIALFVLNMVCEDGESHWMEGVLLLAVYVILGLAFYHLPEAAPMPKAHP